MMFFTKVHIATSSFEIDYSDRILTIGSCFAENIGEKLQNAYFLSFTNPFGISYNPMSVGQSLRCLLNDKEFTEDDLFQSGSLWNSFAHSSAFSSITSDDALQKINSRLIASRQFMREANVVMITLGTAWVYERNDTGHVVANCHKLPSNQFNRRRLSVGEIQKELSDVVALFRIRNPRLRFIFTVSPIRHWKDGAHENTLSKSTLHLAIDEVVKKYDFVQYFPAYEIVIDELRDYRFYASDMLHPSQTAIEYIWKRFSETYFSEETTKLKNELEQLRLDVNHRPLHPETTEYQQFLVNIEKKKSVLIENYPFLSNRIMR
ncbi:MAG: GSCFA domain-containing protein [Paludibacteraceae bacterium]